MQNYLNIAIIKLIKKTDVGNYNHTNILFR